MTRRIPLFAVPLTVAALLAGFASAAQAASTVTINGTTLTVSTGPEADEPRFGFIDFISDALPDYTEINDERGVNIPAGDACTHTNPDPEGFPESSPNYAWCKDGGAAPAYGKLVLNLGEGNDEPSFSRCFGEIEINGGGGANLIQLPGSTFSDPVIDCAGATITVTTGSGQDRLVVLDPNVARVTANLGDGDDEFRGGSGVAEVHGEGGNDTLVGTSSPANGPAEDRLFGDGGDDVLSGQAGNDLLDGGDGDDQFDRGSRNGSEHDNAGSDEYRGGAGIDEADFSSHAAGMTISLNDVKDDGSSGEGDNIHADIEDIEGTTKNDVYTGSGVRDKFDGNSGDDIIHGAGGNDELYGGSAADQVFGDEGDDRVLGDYGDDTVDGGAGVDSMFGDLGSCDSFSCPAFNDTLLSRDGVQDSVQCGAGADKVAADTLDIVAKDGFEACEQVDRASGGEPPPGTQPPGQTSTLLALRGKPTIKKGVGVTVTCPAACSYTVEVVLSAKLAKRYRLGRKTVTIARSRGSLLLAGSKKITLKLSSKARARLKRASKVAATVKITVKDAAGKTQRASKAISLRK